VKVSRTVLRGERESNLPDLPDLNVKSVGGNMDYFDCASCHKEILDDDFETVAFFIRVLPVHKSCMNQFNIGLPLSNKLGSIITILSLGLSLLFYFSSSHVFALFASYPFVMRVVSWLTYRK